jgi:hypothetical protein
MNLSHVSSKLQRGSYKTADEFWFELIGMIPIMLRREADYEAFLNLLSRH